MSIFSTVPPETTPELLPLRIYGDPVLRKKALPVGPVTPELVAFAEQMVETMYANRGIGLAAPQVGRSIRLIVLDTRIPKEPLPPDASPGEKLLTPQMPVALLNPVVLSASAETDVSSEGCLSVPKLYADITRPTSVLLQATLLDGTPVIAECAGLLGRCIQHEIDHLEGVLFPDRAIPEQAIELADKLKSMEKRALKALAKSDPAR